MPLQSREPVQLPMFIDTYYWGDLWDEKTATMLEANTDPWLLTGTFGPYYYATHRWAARSSGAPWPSDTDCAEVTYETLG